MLVGREHRCGEGGVVAAGRLVGGGDDAAHRLGRRRPLDRGQAIDALDDVLGEDRSVGAEGRGRFTADQVVAEGGEGLLEVALGRLGEPHGGDDCAHADDRPEHDQQGAAPPRREASDGDADEIADASHDAPPSVPPKPETVAPPLS